MTNIGWYLMNPHVQRVQKSEYVYSKGGRESLRLSYDRPKFTLISRGKIHLRWCYKKCAQEIVALLLPQFCCHWLST